MRGFIAALLALAGCSPPVVTDCHFRNAECAQGSYCAGHECRPASSSYDAAVTFLVTPADGSGPRAGTAAGPLVPTAVEDPGGARRLVACPTTPVTVASSSARTITGVGRPAENLPLGNVVYTAVSNTIQSPTVLHLAPGSWSFLIDWLDEISAPPLATTLQIANCLAEATFDPEPKDDAPGGQVTVRLFVDQDRDRRPFCDARLDLVDEEGTLRARPVLLEPGCGAEHVLNYLKPHPPLFVRVQGRAGAGGGIPTQLVPLVLAPMELSAVGAPGPPRRIDVHVVDSAGDPVEPVTLFAEGIVLDGTRPWPSAQRPATFSTGKALPTPGQRGTYGLDLVSGCYRIHAVPPPASRSGVGDSDPPGPRDAAPPAFCAPGSFLLDGSTLPLPTPHDWTITLPDRVTLSGAVLAGSGPVSGTRVTAIPVEGRGREVTGYTGDDGTFALRVDPSTRDAPTRYDLLLQPPQGLGLPWYRVAVGRDVSSVTTLLPEGIPLTGSVSIPTGEPLGRALVQAFVKPLRAEPRALGEAITDGDGNFTMILPDPSSLR